VQDLLLEEGEGREGETLDARQLGIDRKVERDSPMDRFAIEDLDRLDPPVGPGLRLEEEAVDDDAVELLVFAEDFICLVASVLNWYVHGGAV
jgi:hypothetical protein